MCLCVCVHTPAGRRPRSPWQVLAASQHAVRPPPDGTQPLEETMARLLERPVHAHGEALKPWEATLVDLQRLYDSLIRCVAVGATGRE